MSLINNTELIQSLYDKIDALPTTDNSTCTVRIMPLAPTSIAESIMCYTNASGGVRTASYEGGVTVTVKKNSFIVVFNKSVIPSVDGAILLHYDSTVAAFLITDDVVLTLG
jgi:hypothetical protein